MMNVLRSMFGVCSSSAEKGEVHDTVRRIFGSELVMKDNTDRNTQRSKYVSHIRENLAKVLDAKVANQKSKNAKKHAPIVTETTEATDDRPGRVGPNLVVFDASTGTGRLVLVGDERVSVQGLSSFSTIRATACVYSGKWMYEVQLGTKGIMQIGWCTASCTFSMDTGVGDTANSYAYDGGRVRRWNVATSPYGDPWLPGDVIGSCVDLDKGIMEFYRLKCGVLATVWLVVRGRRGVELQPFPNIATHTLADCAALQNAVDFQLDHLGNLWVLDIGIIETVQSPRCTCPPKIVVISSTSGKVTKHIELSSLTEPTSQLQNLVIESGLGRKTYVYVSDASRGAILVHDVSTNTGWLVLACAPSVGIQIAIVKPFITHPVLIITRLYHQGVYELDTAVLKRRNSVATLRVFGENTKPVLLLGSDTHHVFFRHVECSDVLSWDTRKPYNASTLINMHSAGPRLTPTSVTADPKKRVLLVLDSNYGDTVYNTLATYQRITFIGQL